MKNKIMALMISLMFVPNISGAQTNSFNKATWYYGLEYYHYHEIDSGHDPFVTIKTNPLPTLVLGYSDFSNLRSGTKSETPIIYYLEGTFGKNEYTNWNSGLGNGNNSRDYKFQTEVSYVTPNDIYIGLGYRYLYDKVSGTGSYDRYNELLYVPVGYGLKMADGSNAKFQFNYLIKGDLSNVNSAYPNINNKQKNGWGLDLSYVPKNSEWEFYAKYWDISKSENVTATATVNGHTYTGTAWEPNNKTYEIGFKHSF
jgi:hypothetical protein